MRVFFSTLHRSFLRVLLAMLATAHLSGCTGRPEQTKDGLGVPRLMADDDHPIELVPSAFQLVQPTAGDRIAPGQPIVCRVRVTLPEDGSLPTAVIFELRQHNAIMDSCSATREEAGDPSTSKPTTCDLVGVIRQTGRVGRFTVETNVMNTHFISPSPGEDSGPKPQTQTFRLDPVEIEIRK